MRTATDNKSQQALALLTSWLTPAEMHSHNQSLS